MKKLQRLDFFSEQFSFLVGPRKKKKTPEGGLQTIIAFSLSLGYLIYLLVLFFDNKFLPKITSKIKNQTNLQDIQLSQSVFKFTFSSNGQTLQQLQQSTGKQYLIFKAQHTYIVIFFNSNSSSSIRNIYFYLLNNIYSIQTDKCFVAQLKSSQEQFKTLNFYTIIIKDIQFTLAVIHSAQVQDLVEGKIKKIAHQNEEANSLNQFAAIDSDLPLQRQVNDRYLNQMFKNKDFQLSLKKNDNQSTNREMPTTPNSNQINNHLQQQEEILTNKHMLHLYLKKFIDKINKNQDITQVDLNIYSSLIGLESRIS
ncbi:hypothetical protein ABPG72_022694 [Tetrahymena utriculariae]